MKFIGAAALIALILPAAAWSAYVALILWGWFIVPSFGVPAPGLWETAGLFLLIRMPMIGLKTDYDPDEDTSTKIIAAVVKAGVVPLMFLGFGWVYHLMATAF